MLRRGAVFAGFVIERELGRGGMGAVYAARDRRLPRLTALKLMHRDLFSDSEIRTRFEREADLIAQLDHPNIITVYDRGVDEERLWISMQFVDGTDASAVPVQQFGNGRIAQITTQTASALDYAHRQGVLHRDVKPANILLSHTAGVGAGFDERVVLTDFGIAKLLDDTGGLTRTGQFTATIAYASPEQLTSAPLDGRSDQYSLACTVFRLLIGTGPFDAPNPATVMLGHLNAPPPMASTRRTTLPAAVDAVLAKAMAKDPKHRFRTCADFAAALTDALRHQPRTNSQPALSASTADSRHSMPTVAPRRHDPTALRDPAAEPENHVPSDTRPATAASIWAGRVSGCLLGGAIGDALGAPVEASTLQQIREEHGHLGIGDDADQLRISEETQLTAFTVEALIRGSVRARAKGTGGATLGLLQQGMLVWLRGQVREIPDQPITLHSSLADHPELTEQRGVAVSVHAALRAAAERRDPTNPLGTRDRPINSSKGSGAVMRASPCGFGYAADRGGSALTTIFELGCDAATLTHGHPSGWLPAGVLAALVYQTTRGVTTMTALDRARAELARYPHHEETSAALEAAISLAARTCRPGRQPRPEDLETLGQGWIAPEALAIAVFTVLAAETVGGPDHLVVRNGLLLSVNHSGDSDATGSIAGSLLGARYGRTALPHRWSHTVDARPVLDRLATDYCTEFGLTPPRDESGQPTKAWFDRYPA
ncbi:ADP-ribosylglycohydrolase family protein [Nocardia sp. NPDC058658]|uniref:ADP-ribosylglycohydrolase family protein n=1 Tax=Nocardia sp. NPDC058658 TaxID=3346580 RepID=UPI003652FF5F